MNFCHLDKMHSIGHVVPPMRQDAHAIAIFFAFALVKSKTVSYFCILVVYTSKL